MWGLAITSGDKRDHKDWLLIRYVDSHTILNDMKIDLHVHTRDSYDATSSLQAIERMARRRNLDGVAVTDHDAFCPRTAGLSGSSILVIWGEEVSTREGEIIGLFLKHQVPSGLSPEETVSAIKEQGGITYLPHPLKQKGRHLWSKRGLEKILPLVDVVEVFNGRVLDQRVNQEAHSLAAEAGALMGAGSDAHNPWEVGRAFVEMTEFDSPAAFLQNLRDATIFGRPPSRLARILLNRLARKALRRLLLTQEHHPFLKKLWLPF